MTTNVGELAAKVEAQARALTPAVDDALANAAKNAVPALRSATPVDTGRLRDGWTARGHRVENTVRYAGFALDARRLRRALPDATPTLRAAVRSVLESP